MLCNVIHVVVFFSLAIAHLTILLQCSVLVESALPPGVEDEIILIEHLPGYRVHLQDFFWTGTENDPRWMNSEQKLTMIETKTIYHTSTLYLNDQENALNDSAVTNPHTISQIPSCPTCIDPTPTYDDVDQNIGIFVGEDPGPRYWLLTVLRAGENVPSNVELRLARLYRTAFNRQQQRHLGLATDMYGRRQRLRRTLMRQIELSQRKRLSQEGLKVLEKVVNAIDNMTLPVKMQFIDAPRDAISLIANPQSLETQIRPFEEQEDIETSTVSAVESNTFDGTKLSHAKSTTNKTIVNPNLVQVSMQNISIVEDVGTKLIYSVHLGGKPVPAETAAKDMALLSPQEVALELGTPVIIQSQPFLRETRPLALSRKRDAWLFIGAAVAAGFMLSIVVITLVIIAKRKRAHSVVLPPPTQSILKRDRDNMPTTPGIDNMIYTSETEARTDGTSQRRTPLSYSRTPDTLATPETLEDAVRDISSDDEDNQKKRSSTPWEIRHYPEIARTIRNKRKNRRKTTINYPKTPDSTDSIGDQIQTLDSLEKGFNHEEEVSASPHSYLSMPSCKQFPNMSTVEPLSRVLESVTVKQLDIEDYDSPEIKLRKKNDDYNLMRVPSATQDPGVIGPIVWDLHKHNIVEGTRRTQADVDFQRVPPELVGRARKRLHELLEDSLSLFGSREIKNQSNSRQEALSLSTEQLTYNRNVRRKERIKSPSTSSASERSFRPQAHLGRRLDSATTIEETGNLTIQPRGAWAARPMSAGPFHRPSLLENHTKNKNANISKVNAKDPAVPSIATISKDLEQFTIE